MIECPLKKRLSKIINLLKKAYPDARTALVHKNPLELLVATILSAQCQDEMVNKVTAKLFEKYRTAQDYANANLEVLEQEIYSTGFYKNKAKNIKSTAKMLCEKYNGSVPCDMNSLLELPGVARKTANVVLGDAFGIAAGIVVDTHVRRLAKRLGISDKENADAIENDLMGIVPQNQWIMFSHLLMHHGRKICKAINPQCQNCILKKECPSRGK